MSLTNANALSIYCPWPLEYTTHKIVLAYFDITDNISIPCQLGCGLEPEVFYLFTPEEQNEIDNANMGFGLCSLFVLIIWFLNLVLQHMEHPYRFHKAALAYQIPFIINIGYTALVSAVLFSPGGHLNTRYPAYCNTDESTISSGDPANGNVACTLMASVIFSGLKIVFSYTLALAFVLFRTLWFPLSRNRNLKCWVHGCVALTIAGELAIVFGLSSVSGNVHIKMCLATLESQYVTLWLEIIPNTICMILCTVFLLLCIFKIWLMNTEEVPPTQKDGMEIDMVALGNPSSSEESSITTKFWDTKTLSRSRRRTWRDSITAVRSRSLAYRLLMFTIIESIFNVVMLFTWIFWWNNWDNWQRLSDSVIQCQLQYSKYIQGGTDPDGRMLESAYGCIKSQDTARPALWSHWLFSLAFTGSAIGGLVLSCSSQNRKRYISCYKWIHRQITVTRQQTMEPTLDDQSLSTGVRPITIANSADITSLPQLETKSFIVTSTCPPPTGAADYDKKIFIDESEAELFEVETESTAKCFSNDRQVPSLNENLRDEVKKELTGKDKLPENTLKVGIAALDTVECTKDVRVEYGLQDLQGRAA